MFTLWLISKKLLGPPKNLWTIPKQFWNYKKISHSSFTYPEHLEFSVKSQLCPLLGWFINGSEAIRVANRPFYTDAIVILQKWITFKIRISSSTFKRMYNFVHWSKMRFDIFECNLGVCLKSGQNCTSFLSSPSPCWTSGASKNRD